MAASRPQQDDRPNLDRWEGQYRAERPRFEIFTEKLHRLLSDLLEGEGIDVVQVESRAKTVESFVGKIERKKGQYANPLSDITDFAGVRVIAYYREDLDRISDLINREFDVDEEHSVQRGSELDPDRFGYLSNHYVVSLGESRRDLAEWLAVRSLRGEIQVRTATQHAWAAVEHKISYKVPGVPGELKRRLYRLSALFELADEQFSAVRQATDELEAHYASALRGGDLDVPIDAASLDAYLAASKAVDAVVEIFMKFGFEVTPLDKGDPKRLERDRRDLLKTLAAMDITTLGALESVLEKESSIKRAVIALKAELEKRKLDLQGFVEDQLTQLLLVLHPTPEVEDIYVGEVRDALAAASHQLT